MDNKLEERELTVNEIWQKYGYTPPVMKPLPKHALYKPNRYCFAFWQRNIQAKPECAALNKMYCMYEECHFYKRGSAEVKA